MRRLTSFALLAFCSVAAQAATITVTHSYEFPDGDYSMKTWTLPTFDASLGELEYVEYYASGSMWADYEFRSMISPGAFSVNVSGFFGFYGPGYFFRLEIPHKGTGQQWVGAKGVVSGRIGSSGNKSGVFISNDPFLAGRKGLTQSVMIYLPQSAGYWTTLVPDVCWHGLVEFTVIYHFKSTTTTPTPEPGTFAMALAAVPFAFCAWRSRRRQTARGAQAPEEQS